MPDPIPPTDPAPPADPAPPGQARGGNGRFSTTDKNEVELAALKKELAELKAQMTPDPPAPPGDTPKKPSAIELKYFESLKADLGKKYDPTLDKVPFHERVGRMEAVKTALKGKVDPIEKGGAGTDAGSPPPPVNNQPKTFLALQQEKDYTGKLRDRGSYAQVAKKLYDTE